MLQIYNIKFSRDSLQKLSSPLPLPVHPMRDCGMDVCANMEIFNQSLCKLFRTYIIAPPPPTGANGIGELPPTHHLPLKEEKKYLQSVLWIRIQNEPKFRIRIQIHCI